MAMMVGRGELVAHLFENEPMGVPRNIYWLFQSELQGDEREARELESVGCDWLTFPVRRFAQLPKLSLGDCMYPELVECTIYRDAEHHLVKLDTLAFEASSVGDKHTILPHTILAVMRISETGSAIASPISIKCALRFEGLVVVPQSLQPAPRTPEAVASIVAPYFDLDELEAPIWDRFRYLFKPKSR